MGLGESADCIQDGDLFIFTPRHSSFYSYGDLLRKGHECVCSAGLGRDAQSLMMSSLTSSSMLVPLHQY